ncbi:MAG TPA: molybdopterin-dependent oxidoreductase [Terriglobales bacterium]|nr:molybdopterin-dependent oxidoreductase [Terriglobales bacterium]
MERRDFMKAAGIAAAGGAVAGCRTTGHILPLVVPDQRYIEGVPEYFATVCRECPAGCGMRIRVNEGRATKPEGNPQHPVNRGKLCMRGQSSVQGLYSPDRWQAPLLRNRRGQLEEVSWKTALGRLQDELARVEGEARGADAVWLGRLETGSLDRLIRDWLAAFGFPPPLYYEPFGYEALREASRWAYGQPIVPGYRFDRARMILSFGAEFLAAWVSNVQFAVDFALTHSYGHTHDPAYFIAVGPRVDLTGANADENWGARPGAEALLALAVAERVAARLGRPLRLPPGLPAGTGLDAAQLEQATAVPADVVERAAARLVERRPSLVLGPGQANESSAALTAHAICHALNELLGNVGVTVLPGAPHALSSAARHEQVAAMFARAQAGQVRLLFLHHANPAYDFPGAANVEAALARIPFIVSFGWWPDETSKHAHLVLPDHYPLESWGDYEPWAGVTGLMQPAMRPVFDTRPAADVLLWLAAQAGAARQRALLAPLAVAPAPPLDAETAPPGSNWRQSPMGPAPNPDDFAPPAEVRTFDAYLRRRWQLRLAPAGSAAEQADAWRNLLMRGVHLEAPAAEMVAGLDMPERMGPPLDTERRAPPPPPMPVRTPAALPYVLPAPAPAPPPSWPLVAELEGDGEYVLWPYPTVQFFDGRQANRAWMQEIADPLSKLVWDNWVQVHPDTGWKLQVAEGDILRLDSPYGHAEFPVHVDPYIRPDTLAIPLGQGHRDFGMFASGRGMAVEILASPRLTPAGGPRRLGVRVQARHVGKHRDLANLQLIHWQRDKKIALATTLAEADTPAAREKEVRATFYAFHPHPVHRWGMAIDLSSCIGCNACQTACYAENNIPIMGRSSCLSHREMTWLRIETYGGDSWHPSTAMNPDIRFMPIPCQQCGNAPCEYVCPVFAAYHTEEGLNAQVYNRCVGTRYCSNNCIYKVRRFNWYTPQWPKPLDQQLNPAVTVRAKGVMEKCTYCVQRIETAELAAKAENRPIRDGEIQTACMQTCPTEAIIFGDLRDPESRVSKLHDQYRGYRWFAEENTFPSITYLKRTKYVLNQV